MARYGRGGAAYRGYADNVAVLSRALLALLGRPAKDNATITDIDNF
jgi:hypothetical protein